MYPELHCAKTVGRRGHTDEDQAAPYRTKRSHTALDTSSEAVSPAVQKIQLANQHLAVSPLSMQALHRVLINNPRCLPQRIADGNRARVVHATHTRRCCRRPGSRQCAIRAVRLPERGEGERCGRQSTENNGRRCPIEPVPGPGTRGEMAW